MDIQRPSSWLAFLSIAMVLAITLGGCASSVESWQAPEVTLIGIQPREIGLARQSFVLTLAVRNPNDRALPIQAMRYHLSLEGEEIARGGGQLDRLIPPQGEDRVDVEVTGDLLSLAARLPRLARQPGLFEWSLSGTLTLSGGLIVLPYRYSGTLDARQWIETQGASLPLTTDH